MDLNQPWQQENNKRSFERGVYYQAIFVISLKNLEPGFFSCECYQLWACVLSKSRFS